MKRLVLSLALIGCHAESAVRQVGSSAAQIGSSVANVGSRASVAVDRVAAVADHASDVLDQVVAPLEHDLSLLGYFLGACLAMTVLSFVHSVWAHRKLRKSK